MLVHGDNLTQKQNSQNKYADLQSKQFLAEIRVEYERWKAANELLKGPLCIENEHDLQVLQRRIDLFSDYKNFIDQQRYAEKFDARSNLHSSVLEEFMYYLFRDLVFEFFRIRTFG